MFKFLFPIIWPRLSILAIIVLFVAGGALLVAVNEPDGVEHGSHGNLSD